jgi:tetratricopeptide (TPR) repeat protein
MAPEQATARGDVGPAADVYGLGATLYCLLTGKPPFGEGDLLGVLARVATGDFPPPSRVNREVPPPLEAVCRKAMARDPAGRYASPLDLAADIERWLADEPVSVYREPLLTRLARWSRRHLVALTVLGAFALLAVLLLPFLLVLFRPGGAGGGPLAPVVEARQRLKSAKNLRDIAKAIENFDASKPLPPPKHENGQPLGFPAQGLLPLIEQNPWPQKPGAGKQAIPVYVNHDRAARDQEAVVRVMTDILKQVPGRSEAYVERARALLALGKAEQAREDLDRAAKINQGRSDVHLARAAEHARQGRHAEALADAKAAVLLQPASPLVYRKLAEAREAAGDRAAAALDREVAAALAGKKP